MVFLSQSGQAADGNPPGHHGQIGRQARSPRKATEHRGIVVQNFEQDVCQQVIAIGRREGHLSLGSGAIDDKGEQATKPRHERIPSLRQPLQALLEESPILRRKDHLRLRAVSRMAMVGRVAWVRLAH